MEYAGHQADLLAPKPYGDNQVSEEGVLTGYVEDHMEANILVSEHEDEQLISEESLSLKYLENHTETNLFANEPKYSVDGDVLAMMDGDMHSETAVPVVKPNDQEPMAEEFPMAYTTGKYIDVPVAADLKDEYLTAEKVFPMEYGDIHPQLEAPVSESEQKIEEPFSIMKAEMPRETNVPSDVPKNEVSNDVHVHKMVDDVIHMEREVPVSGEQKDEKHLTQESVSCAETDILWQRYVPVDESKGGEPMTEDGFPFLCPEEEAKMMTGVLEGLTDVETEADATEVETDNGVLEMDTETDVGEAETELTDMESKAAEVDTEMAEDGGKRKRTSKALTRVSQKKKIEEDVCFICFDGGELVICDRRGCPKAYHPSCVNRDEAFFKAKGRWNCGWHICSACQKNSYYTCYTCTYSLCKGCIKDGVLSCVRGNKGFCDTCLRTILLIENNEQGNSEMGQVDFDDKNCWEYLFKDYWTDLKGSLCLTLDELTHAKNPWKASNIISSNEELPRDLHNVDSISDQSEKHETVKPKRRKGKRLSKPSPSEAGLPDIAISDAPASSEWASKELVEFVMHMKNGDGSTLSQFDVQALLLDYIKKNKLRDPRKKSQIICDSRLQNLFGKARVGHFEMLKLLESHFLMKKDFQADGLQGHVVDTDASQVDIDGNVDILAKSSKDRKRKMRKKGDRVRQSNLDDYAAIDLHNINLIYLRRNLMEDLIEDVEKFHEKVMNSFVRIRISGPGQKQDIYRLVQVVGTCKAARPYKVGKRTTDLMLDILNLNKIEVISIDIISNQDFSEDECKRLRQSIKCGLINRITVGDFLEKVEALHAVRINDWMETEITRISHLRDRASETGRQKELRECVEKLQILNTAEERQRKLEEIPEVHADPKMDPSYESEEDVEEVNKSQAKSPGAGFGRGVREPISPRPSARRNSNKNMSDIKDHSNKNIEFSRSSSDIKDHSNKNMEFSRSFSDIKDHSNKSTEFTRNSSDIKDNSSNNELRIGDEQQSSNVTKLQTAATSSAIMAKANETDKAWHYKDPSGKIQGPFSMTQLRKWNNTGYFPVDLRIWIATGMQEESVLLADALLHVFPREQPLSGEGGSQKSQNPKTSSSSKPHGGERARFEQEPVPVIEDQSSGQNPNYTPDAKKVSTDQFVHPNPNSGWGPNQQQQQGYGQWVNSNQSQTPAGGFPASFPPSSPWRPPQIESGSTFQTWNMGLMPENQNAVQSLRPENPVPASWGPMPGSANMGWVGPAPVNTNVNWVGPGGPNVNWAPNMQGGNTPAPQGGANMNWGGNPNPNPNMNWVQSQGQGNVNPGWVAPGGNSNMWGNNQGQNGNRGLGQRDTGRPPWNRNGGRGMNRTDGVCKYYENGRCIKGASCKFFHPQG